MFLANLVTFNLQLNVYFFGEVDTKLIVGVNLWFFSPSLKAWPIINLGVTLFYKGKMSIHKSCRPA